MWNCFLLSIPDYAWVSPTGFQCNFQQWQEAGSPQAAQKANALWKQALAEYREPYLDPAISEEIDSFVARRSAEGGEPTDF